jgi:CcmD family protein
MIWMFAAFSIVWLFVVAYLLKLGNMQKKLEDEIASLK